MDPITASYLWNKFPTVTSLFLASLTNIVRLPLNVILFLLTRLQK